MQDDVLRQVEQFLYREARMLDSRQFRRWIDLLADDLRYWIPIRSNRYSAASKSISILDGSRYEEDDLSKESDQAFMDEDKGSLRRRVDRLDTGMAWAEGSLWVGQYRKRKIHQVDPETGAVLRTLESDRFVTGVTWINDELWHGTWEGDDADLRHIDSETGEVLERIDMPEGVHVSGLTYDGNGHFYCGGGPSGKVRAVSRHG